MVLVILNEIGLLSKYVPNFPWNLVYKKHDSRSLWCRAVIHKKVSVLTIPRTTHQPSAATSC